MNRKSFIQDAQTEIVKQLQEGSEKQFFASVDILSADNKDFAAEINRAVAQIGLAVIVEILGGPMPIPDDPTEWNALITVTENPTVNRSEGGSRKAADVVVDAIMRAFRDGGWFAPTEITAVPADDLLIWEIKGKCIIVLHTNAVET